MGRIKKIGALFICSFFLISSAFAQSTSHLISDVVVSDVTSKSATVSWSSSDINQVSFINFVYGTSEKYGKRGYPRLLSDSVSGQKLNFQVNLQNLEGGKQFYYKIQISDDIESTAYKGNFTTLFPDTTKPLITSVTVVPQSEKSAVIYWKTDEPADCTIDYYEDNGNVITKQLMHQGFSVDHEVFLGNLESDTVYFYKIRSKDQSNNEAVSEVFSFKTFSKAVPPPNVANLRSENTNESITIYWKNPVYPAFDQVQVYKKADSPASRDSGNLVYSGKSEKFVDSEVLPGKTYYYTLYTRSTSGSFSSGSIIIDSVSPVDQVAPEKINIVPTSSTDDIHEKHSVEEHQAFLAIKRISNNADVEKSVETFVAPTLAGFTIFNIFSSISLINLLPLIHLLIFEPFVFLGRRNKVGWGIVYNSVNKHPVDLAMVRLINRRTGKVVQSKVTDSDGRFAFTAKPGEYAMQVSKDNFTFPSHYLRGMKDDGQIFDIYSGSTFEVSARESLITANIPVDPPGNHELPLRYRLQELLITFQGILSWVGLPITLVSLIISPRWFMWPLLVVQFLLFMLYKRIARPVRIKNWGIVYDEQTKKPIERAIVRLYNVNHDRLAHTEVTDSSGRYHFLAGNGKYYIVCESSSYERVKTPIIYLADRKKQSIVLDIGLKKIPPEKINKYPSK